MKKVFYITLAILILGGTAFALSQSNLLKGTFFGTRSPSTTLTPGSGIVTGSTDIDTDFKISAASYLEEIEDQLQIAMDASKDAESAYNSNNQTALSTAQINAEIAYNTASDAYQNIQELADSLSESSSSTSEDLDFQEGLLEKSITKYKNLIEEYATEWPDYYSTVKSVNYTISSPKPEDLYAVVQEIRAEYESCQYNESSSYGAISDSTDISTICDQYTSSGSNDEGGYTFPTISEAEEAYDTASEYYENYEAELAEYEDLQASANSTGTRSDTVDSYLKDAESNLSKIEEYMNMANSYEIAECGSINLDPASYTMTSSETSASFSFKITVEPEASTRSLPKKVSEITQLIQATMFGSVKTSPSVVQTTGASNAKWTGTLKISTDNTAKFKTGSTTVYKSPIEVDTDSESTTTIQVKFGSKNETITVADAYSSSCKATLKITQKTELSINDTRENTVPTVVTTPDEDTEITPITNTTTDETTETDTDTTTTTTTTTDTSTSNGDDEVVDELTPAEEEIIQDESYVCSTPFTDTYGHWAKDQICRMYDASVVNGKSTTKFDPEGDITRAEAIKVIVIMAGYGEEDATGLTTDFLDVHSGDWYYKYLLIAEDKDIIRTRDFGNNFGPNEAISRADLILYAIRAAGKTSYNFDTPFTDVKDSDYFAYAVSIASSTLVDVPYDDTDEEVNVIEGYSDNTFKPYNSITRAEAITIAYRMYLAWFQ